MIQEIQKLMNIGKKLCLAHMLHTISICVAYVSVAHMRAVGKSMM